MNYVTPWSGKLEIATYEIGMPTDIQIGINILSFKQWEDGSTNPTRLIDLSSDKSISATYVTASPISPWQLL